MKIECSCGAKYEFEVRPEMQQRPVSFVCPNCGADASAFVDRLVRRELGQNCAPAGEPVPALPPPEGPGRVAGAAAGLRVRRSSDAPVAVPAAAAQESPACPKHPGQPIVQTCYICSRPICPKCMELFGYVCSPLCKAKAESHGITLPVYEGQKAVVDARRWRKVVWTGSTVGIFLAVLLGVWFWYDWFGCAPKAIFSVRFPEPAYSGQSVFAGSLHNQIVFLHGGTLARYDLQSGRAIWSSEILDHQAIQRAVDRQTKATQALIDKAISDGAEQVPKMPSPEQMTREMERAATAALTLRVRRENIWVVSPGKLVRYDWGTGRVAKEVAVGQGAGEPIYRGSEVLLVDTASGKPAVTHVDLASGETRTESLSGNDSGLALQPSNEPAPGLAGGLNAGANPHALAGLPTPSLTDAGKPLDPSKVAAQAQHMSLAQRIALPATLAVNINQQRALQEMNNSPSQPAPAPDSVAPEQGFSLVPAPDGFLEFSVQLLEKRIIARSAMKPGSGQTALDGATAGQSMDMAGGMLNDMQRANGGDLVQEDHSRYQVTVRRPGSPGVWTGEVTGPPKLYPLDSVTVLAADKLIVVLNQANQKLWQSSLAFNVPADIDALDEESATYGRGPCVEHKGSLYVFDQGVLSAFDLANGNARWRLPTVGVAGLFFDDHDMLYVNTTTASHESLKYSRQIDLSRKVVSVVLKVDARNGKILWSEQSSGLVNYVSGKLLLTAASFAPADQEGTDTGLEQSPWLRIRRLNPSNGREIWEHFQDRAPLDIGFDHNTIRLVFKKEVQVLRFPTF